MRRQIRREIRLLRWWTLASTGALVVVSMATLLGQGQVRGTRFDEVSVERINVVEPDGRVRLVVANSARQADAVIDGKVVGAGRNRPAGLILSARMSKGGPRWCFPMRRGDSVCCSLSTWRAARASGSSMPPARS
jgi:hypothetical protein